VKLRVVSQRNFLWHCFCLFFNTYFLGTYAGSTLAGIFSGLLLTIKTFVSWHKFHKNAIITHATQKSLDYFIIRFLSFYQINATKVEKLIYYTRFIRRTVTLVLLEHSPLRSTAPTNSCHNQASYKTRIIMYYFVICLHFDSLIDILTNATSASAMSL
jgi:hypothetical protein